MLKMGDGIFASAYGGALSVFIAQEVEPLTRTGVYLVEDEDGRGYATSLGLYTLGEIARIAAAAWRAIDVDAYARGILDRAWSAELLRTRFDVASYIPPTHDRVHAYSAPHYLALSDLFDGKLPRIQRGRPSYEHASIRYLRE